MSEGPMTSPMSDERRREIDTMWTLMPLGAAFEPEIGELLDEVDRLRAELARKDEEPEVVWFVIGGYYDTYYEDGPWATKELAEARMAQLNRRLEHLAMRDMYAPSRVVERDVAAALLADSELTWP